MGFFNRKPRDGTHQAAASSHGHNATTAREHTPAATYTMLHRPTFGQWLKLTWKDIITMVLMGALGLGVCHPLSHPRYSPKVSPILS